MVENGESGGPIDIPEGLTEEWLIEKSKHLRKKFKEWKDATWGPVVDDNYKLFEGKSIAGMMDGAVLLPIGNSIIDTNMARFMSAINGREKLVDAKQNRIPDEGPVMDPNAPVVEGEPPQQAEGITPEERIRIVEDLVNQSLVNTPDFMDKCDEMFKLLLLETVCVAEAYWDDEVTLDRVLQRQRNELGQPVPVGEEYKEFRKSFPNFNVLSLRSLVWSPRVKDKISQSPYISKRASVSVDDLMDLEEKGIIKNVQRVLEVAPKANNESGEGDPDAERAKNVEGQNLPHIDFSDAKYHIDEWYATLIWRGKDGKLMRDEFRYWIVGEEVMVRFVKNDLKPVRKPFVSSKLNRKPGMLLGQGPMDLIKPIVVDIANVMRSKNKLVRQAATTPTFVEPSAGLDLSRQVLEESALIPVLNARGVVPSQPPVQAIGLIDQHARFLIGQAKEATSSNDLMQGTGSASADTATEAKILEAGASTRFQYNFEMVMSGIFGPLAKEYHLMYKQFLLDGEATVNDAGVDGRARKVYVEDIQGDYEFKAVASQALQNRMGRFKLLEGLLVKLVQAAQTDPTMLTTKDGTMMKLMPFEFLSESMLPLVDVKGVGGLFRKLTPEEQMQAQQMKMMMQQRAAMGGGAPGAPNPSAQGGGPAVLPGAE